MAVPHPRIKPATLVSSSVPYVSQSLQKYYETCLQAIVLFVDASSETNTIFGVGVHNAFMGLNNGKALVEAYVWIVNSYSN